jgi:hypothetical protein
VVGVVGVVKNESEGGDFEFSLSTSLIPVLYPCLFRTVGKVKYDKYRVWRGGL